MTMPMEQDLIHLYNLTRVDLIRLMGELGQPAFRAKQIYRHLYVNLTTSFDAMTDLPTALRETLAGRVTFTSLTLRTILTADQGMTRKALFALPDGSPAEAVLMVYPDRATVCVSSQSGCPMACVFCATGKLGHLHDLTAGQIIEQVLWAERTLKEIAADARSRGEKISDHLTNVVYMGMGEPFNNYQEWWTSVERLHDPEGFNFGARNFTVSTVGLIPGIRRLAEESLPINLAISLHAPDDELRSNMMPVNRRYPIKDLIDAVRDYTAQTRRRVSFEYVLLKEKNDLPEQAERLADLLRPAHQAPLLCHVNLIPWNPVPGSPLSRSDRKRVLAFQEVLLQRGVACTVRVERGAEIAAACGQLAGAV
ncbi:MAG: 23S rRNA (adenine(2503)-C(2))-methyltransferase RlmN [Verrucomicrobia bacterium]|nr:23S rRNA (adenine(2503)-C(2))-methyltransferase RlmN [Kiritimatiellia bacterium]MCP5487640.1 23S rRNA (adenine(2503)-C(2))-methyltransferase RlmN [Verrucomicrobiota bacterium]